MTTKEAKLTDFTEPERTDDETDPQENTGTITHEAKTASPTEVEDTDDHENRSSTNSSDEESSHMCSCYLSELTACEDRIGSELMYKLSIDKIECGHAIDYLSREVNVTLTKNTVEGYTSYLRQYVEFLHERGVTVCDAEIQDVKEYFRRLVQLNRAEGTIASHRSAITNLYKHISINKDIETSVRWSTIREVINPSEYNTPEPREREPLTKGELTKLYDSAGSFRNRLILQVGAELGPRNKDLRSIRVDDIDFENHQIELSNTKGGGRYTLPISNQLSLLLRRWVEEERPAHPGAESNDYLFPSRQGGSLGKPALTNLVKDAAERAGIQEKEKSNTPLTEREKQVLDTDQDYVYYSKVTPHTLRHTFNHLLNEAGVPRDARSRALDHQSEEVTKDFYDHQESSYKELIKELFEDRESLLNA